MKKNYLLKKVLFIALIIFAGLSAKSQILSEGFESATFPPSGWQNVHTAGANPDSIWQRATNGAFAGSDINSLDFTIDPHSGTGMAYYSCYTYDPGETADLISPAVNLTTPGAKTVSFWMYRDDGLDFYHDSIVVYINTSASASGATLLGVVHRLVSDDPIISTGKGWYKYTYSVPAGFNTATNYFIFEAVSDFGNNMFIDDISVDEFASCTGTPSAGTITGPASACAGRQIVLENTGATNAAGIEYDWQTSPNMNGPWTDVVVQTTLAPALVTQTSASYYRLLVTCGASFRSDSSNVVYITINPQNTCYCKPPDVQLHSNVNDYITNVTIQGTSLNSSNGTDGTTGYSLVPSTPSNNTGNLSRGVTYTVVATLAQAPGYPQKVSCWIDFNGNGIFEASEFADLPVSGNTASGSITVPTDALLTVTGFRIRARAANITAPDACTQFLSGETEDYLVTINSNTALNGGLVDIIPPSISCNASNNVIVKFRNSGNQNIAANAATIALYVTGANPQGPLTQTNPSLVLPGDTATLTFIGSFPAEGTNTDSAVIQSLAGDIVAGDNVFVTSHITLPAPANAPYVEDFEGAVPGWLIEQISGTGNWGITDSVSYPDFDPPYKLAAKSGGFAAMFDSYNFTTGTISRLSSNCINIPADANTGCGYVAGFYFTQDAQYNNADSVVLNISNDGGNTFTRLGVVKRQDSTLTPSLAQQGTSIPEWKLYSFDVSQYAGATVQFAIDGFSRFGNQMAIDSFFVGPKTVGGNVALAGAQETGASLAPSLAQCTDANGWTYYSDGNSSRFLFGIQWDPANSGANAGARGLATAKVTVDRKWYAAENVGLRMATYTMQRYWDVNLNGAVMNGPANIRFFYSQREFDSIIAAKDNFIATTGGADEGFRWFKTVSGEFIPSPSSVNFDSVVNDLELQNVNTTGATINGVLYAQFNSITSFSGGTAASGVGPTTPLPVGLVSFNAQRAARVNRISWTTTQEINTDKFVIERSTGGRNFSSIGEAAAAGNSSNNINYSFIDYTPVMGVNFYRLRVVERNGSAKYSPVRSVRNEGTADIAVYPNPVKDRMLINITSDRMDKAVVTISDMNGRTVQVKSSTISEGSNYININTAAMSTGTYVIKIQLNDDVVVKKVNKL